MGPVASPEASPEASPPDRHGPPPAFDAAALAPPSEASPLELILSDLPDVLIRPEDELAPEGPAPAGTEVLESVLGEDPEDEVADVTHEPYQDILVPDAEEEVVVEDVLSEPVPDAVDMSKTVVEDLYPENEEPPSETVAEEFITGRMSVVLSKPTVASSEDANSVGTPGQDIMESPPGDVIHHVQETAVLGEGPEGDRSAGPPSDHPPDEELTPDGTRIRTNSSETPVLMVLVGEDPDPVPETKVTTQAWVVLTTSEQMTSDKVTSETSGGTTADAETPNTLDDGSKEREGTAEEIEDGQVLGGETITGPPEAAAKPSRTPTSIQEPEEETAKEGEVVEEPTNEADGRDKLLEEPAGAGGKPGTEPSFVEEGPKKTKEKVPTGASQQEPGSEVETVPVIPSLENLEVASEKVDEDDAAEAEEDRPLPDSSETSEKPETTEVDEAEALLPGSGVEETPEIEEEVPAEATENTAVEEPTADVLESVHDSEKEPIPGPPSIAPPEVVPDLAEGGTNQLSEISSKIPREPVLNTSPVSPTEISPKVEDVTVGVTAKYVVEYNNGNFPDLTQDPFGGDEDLLGNDGFDLDAEEENSVRSLSSSADAVSEDVTFLLSADWK